MSDLAGLAVDLQQTINKLSREVDLLSLRVAALESSAASNDGWELVEPEDQAFGGLSHHRIALEEGPPELPAALESFASVLSDIGGGKYQRAKAAFRAGYFAQLAVETSTEYHPEDNPALSFSHWIVLRGAGLPSPVRVTRKSDLNRLVSVRRAARRSETAVIQGFASLAELRIFCGGARIAIPTLVRWTSSQ